jgi:hypothetical protein
LYINTFLRDHPKSRLTRPKQLGDPRVSPSISGDTSLLKTKGVPFQKWRGQTISYRVFYCSGWSGPFHPWRFDVVPVDVAPDSPTIATTFSRVLHGSPASACDPRRAAPLTGLRRGEIVGLKWEDYDGKVIHVRRNICFGQKGEMSVELPKTEASEAPVPVIAPLRDILDAWKKKAEVTEGCWIFQAGFTRKKDHPQSLLDAARLTPLSPANVLRDVVFPALKNAEIEWLGYHAFRRGLATNLRALGVDDLTISEILRHSDVSVTRNNYIKRVSEKSVEAMNRLEAELRKPVQSVRKGATPVTKAARADAVVPVGMA